MRFVKDWQDISTNIRTLAEGVVSDDSNERMEYRKLVWRGTCFIVADFKGQVIFAPSRFIGYAENSIMRHQQFEEKDGRDTNPVIAEILRASWKPDAKLEELYQCYCKSLGLIPRKAGTANVTRKYIDMRNHPI